MAKKKFLVNIDLNLNQLINSRAENGTGFTTGGINSKGRLMYDTSTNRVLYDTGVAIESIANLNDVTGLLDFHGGYNALTNTPNLVNPPSGTILKGDYYIVTVAGTFYGTALEIGDSLFASIDNPTSISGWVIVNANVVYATETIAGIILLATQNEVNTGTNNSKAVTPLTLSTYVTNTRQNIYNTDGTLTANRTINLSDKDLNFIGSGTSTYNYKVDNGVQTSEIYLDANQVQLNLFNETLTLNSRVWVINGEVALVVGNGNTINRSLKVNSFGTRINNTYYLPNVDGTAGQVIITDGAGNLSWGTSSSLNIYNGNGSLTSDRTVSLGDKNLYFVGSGVNQVFQTTQANGSTTSIFQHLLSEINHNVEVGSDYSNRSQSAYSIYQRVDGVEGQVYSILQQLSSQLLLTIQNTAFSIPQYCQLSITSIDATLSLSTSGGVNTLTEFKLETNQINLSIQSDDILFPFNTRLAILPEGVTINGSYHLPNTDGTAGQVITTDGAGNLSWGTGGSGNTNIYNTNGTLTANRTVTINDRVLLFEGNLSSTFRVSLTDPITERYTIIDNTLTRILNQVGNNDLTTYNTVDITSSSVTTTTVSGAQSSTITSLPSTITNNVQALTNSCKTELTINGFRINNAYTLPKVDGTNGQILTTNGSGTVSWATSLSNINIYNTNGTLTADRTVNVSNKVLTYSGTNGSIIRNYITDAPTNSNTLQIQSLTSIQSEAIADQNSGSVIVRPDNVEIYAVNTFYWATQTTTPISQEFKITDRNTFTDVFKTTITANGLNINDVYTFPKVDGTSGQVLTTNGAGLVSWGTGSNVNIYNTDGTLTANRVVTLATNNLSFNGTGGITTIKQTNTVSGNYSSIANNENYNLLRVSDSGFNVYSDINQGQQYLINTVQNTNTSVVVSHTPISIITTVYDTNVTNVAFRLDVLGTGLKINNAYTLPKVDGTAGQVLTTDGAGVITWGAGGSGGTNIYNTNGTLTANRTLTALNFNLGFSGVGFSGVTSFSRSDGSFSQTNYDLRYDYFNVVSNTANETASMLISPTQILKGVDDSGTGLSTNYQQFSTAFRFYVNDSIGVTNSLTIQSNGININNVYTLPKVDGTAGQVLTTDGAGAVTWTTSGIGTSDIWKLNPNETFRGFSFNNNSTTIVSEGGAVASATASTLAQTVSGTSFVNKQVRLRYYASVVSAGRYTGLRGSALLWFIGGGFRYVCDFNISDTAYASGCQQFYGVANQTTDLAYAGVSGVQISTLLNIIGVGNETADANLQIFHNDATGTATKIDLGSGFPANRTSGAVSTTVYEIQILNLPATTSIQYRVVNKETGAIATGTLTTNLPDATLGLNFFASRCMSTLGSVTNTGQFDLCKLGVYSML